MANSPALPTANPRKFTTADSLLKCLLAILVVNCMAHFALGDDLLPPLSQAAREEKAKREERQEQEPLKVAALISLADRRYAEAPAALPAPPRTETAPDESVEPGEEVATARTFRPIGELTINAALPAGEMSGARQEPTAPPVDVWPTVDDLRREGAWAHVDVPWAPTNMVHRPLYFEEVNLERYGYTVSRCLQPALSGARFFVTVPALPYFMAVQPQRNTYIYTLGHYRPGSYAPRRAHMLVTGTDGAGIVAEAATVITLVFLIP